MVFVGAESRFHCALDDVNATWYKLNQSDLKTLLIPKDATCYRYEPNATLSSVSQITSNVNYNDRDSSNGSVFPTESCPAGYTYSKEQYESTITSQFDLVCSRKFWRSTSKSVFFGGRLAGAVVFGQLSDRFGRRPMFFVGVALLAVAGGVAAAAPSMMVFLPMYFLQGAAHTGAFLVSFTLSTELVGPRYRVEAGFVIQCFYSVGYMSLAGIAYFVRNWRYLEVAITAPALLFVIYWWFLPESVRWLLSRSKHEEAARVLQKVANGNGRELPPDLVKELQVDPAMTGTRQYTFIDCVRTWKMARLSLNVWFNWLVNALVYYGLSLNTENLAGSPYINFCIAGAVEIPAYIMCILLLNRVGRRLPLIVTMYLGGVACILSGIIPKHSTGLETFTVVLAMVGKFGITASYAIIYLAAAEVFPTVVRNIGMGVSSMSARIGGILAPVMLETASVTPILPMILFGGLSMLAATLAFLLPETEGRPMPQLLEDVDKAQSWFYQRH
nr:hypothetical protein BaRGS_034819 [Batillaria attramentaria]